MDCCWVNQYKVKEKIFSNTLKQEVDKIIYQ